MTTASDNLAADYAKRIARGFYDADSDAPFGYRDDSDTEFDTLADVLDDAEIEGDDRDDYDADNLPDGYRVASGMDYVSEALDFRFEVGSDRAYRSGSICIGLGGPNVWINLDDATVAVYWGGTAREAIPYAVRDLLDDALEELWEMGA